MTQKLTIALIGSPHIAYGLWNMHAVLLGFCLFVYVINCGCIYGANLLLSFWGWFAIQWTIALITQYRGNNAGVYDEKRPYQTTAKYEQLFILSKRGFSRQVYAANTLYEPWVVSWSFNHNRKPHRSILLAFVRQRVDNAESVSIWWRRYVIMCCYYCPTSPQVHSSAFMVYLGGSRLDDSFVVMLDRVFRPLYIESMIFHHMRFLSYPDIVIAEVVEIVLPTFYCT